MRTLFLTAVGLAGVSLSPSSPWSTSTAHATSIAPLTVGQMTDASTWIVRGTIVETWTDLDANGRVWSHARVQVAETFKGFDSPAFVVIDQIGGQYGSVVVDVGGTAGMTPTEDILAFLYQDPETGRVGLVGKFRGKYAIRRAPGETRSYVRHTAIPSSGRYDGRFLTHPPPERRLYLEDILAQVRDQLAVGWNGDPIPGLSDADLARLNTIERRIAR